MTAEESVKQCIKRGISMRDTARDYAKLRSEPFTEIDFQGVYRLQEYRDARNYLRVTRREAITVEVRR